ncbi:proline and serine-rich protein 2 [Bubalus bubalis]|uniref:proline and serine-rich protein 2 n=1 Tax=Bubalus bubalis TaxID=89462 RepID=UPI001E1B7794|nr:proline and serine-rich protein 2 [Bubalus bubalis]XP_044784174.2 proline and serine-rich protein 2 [Bubalus bubalis]
MPVHHRKSDSWEMDPDSSPGCRLGDLSRGSSLESQASSSRSRSLTLDDESLKYLTHEEKDVLLFFEETIDSLEDDFEEQVLCAGDAQWHSPRSLEESTSAPSEPEDVVDLVQPGPGAGEPESLGEVKETTGAVPFGKEDPTDLERKKEDAEKSPPSDPPGPEALPSSPPASPAAAPAHPRREPPTPPAEHPKLTRSVPTPLVIAQKISEKLAGNEGLSPTSPSKEGRPAEWRTLASLAPRHGDHSPWHRHAAQPAPKIHRFPSNISVTNSAGKDFNKTISKAAVNVQERKAQVLANINGVSFLSVGETEDRAQRGEPTEQRSVSPEQSQPGPAQEAVPTREGARGAQQCRGVQTEQPLPLANGFQSIHDVLKSQAGPFVSTGKTVTFRPDPALPSRLEPQQPDCGQAARKRSGSLPRAVGFRPQGITVQFSGRGSTEEARREALRKLGLLKENL